MSGSLEVDKFQHPSISTWEGKRWFREVSEEAFPGQSFCLEIEEILHHEKSQFQDILIFKSTTFGNVLVLNGIVQCTEKDEFAYQELITHLPVMSHPHPKRVLVIGGGDCGVVRELVKHLEYGVEDITMVEIDDRVIKLSTKYLPNMAKYHNHPKVNLIIDDGFKYLNSLSGMDEKDRFDVIITDSSDPEGPAEEFFQVNYFNLLKNALNTDGIVIMQSSENIWLNISYLNGLIKKAKNVFSNVKYSQCYMPSYTSGQLGLIIATNDTSKILERPLRQFSSNLEEELFKYYNSNIHSSSFVLPTWANKLLNN